MKNEEIVKIQEMVNGYMISWPMSFWASLFGPLYEAVFYEKNLKNIPKDKIAVVKSSDVTSNYCKISQGFFDNYTLVDVCYNAKLAKERCKEKTLEIAKEKAKGKYEIVQKTLEELLNK